ncbi:Os04g0405900, partial [Oryza sativa Japonica Group]
STIDPVINLYGCLGLDPREKVMELGSRSFFLCPKSSAAVHAPSPSCSSDEASRIRDRDAPAAARAGAAPAWVSYMQFWPMM